MTIGEYKISWWKFVVGMIISLVLSLSIHIIMLQGFNVPFPDFTIITAPYKFITRVVVVFALILFCDLAGGKARGGAIKMWGLLFIIDAMLTETLFRAPFMSGYCSNSIAFMLISNIPNLLTLAAMCGLIVFIAPWLNSLFTKFIGAAAIAAIFMFAVGPLLTAGWKPVLNSIAHLAPTGEWCNLPYGPNVLIPSYISFIEPVIACMMMAMLIWDRLLGVRWMKYLQFILIVLAIKNQLLLPIFYTVLGKDGFMINLASDAQFTLEAIILALATGYTFEWSVKKEPKTDYFSI